MVNLEAEWMTETGKYRCPYCDKEYSKNGICTHIWRSHGDGKSHNPNIGYKNKRVAWNKGLTKDSDIRIARSVKVYKKRMAEGKIIPHFRGKKHSSETKALLSKIKSDNPSGGWAKWYIVDGVKLQGTWERDFALLLNDRGIKWFKPKNIRYCWDGIERTYRPDLYLPEFDLYIEIKGRWWNNDKLKMQKVIRSNRHLKIKILRSKDKFDKFIDSLEI